MRRSFLITGILFFLTLVTNAFGDIRVGDTAEYVDQEKGAPISRSKLGDYDTLTYKDGTKITLKDGIVTDITVRGQIQIGSMSKVVEPQRPLTATRSSVSNSNSAPTNRFPATVAARVEAPPTQTVAKVEAPPEPKTNKPAKHTEVAYRASPLPPIAVSGVPANTVHFPKFSKAALAVIILVSVVVTLVFHVLFSWCFKLICLKTGYDPGLLIWVPIAQCIPLLRVAKMPELMLLLMFVPLVNCVFFLIMWAKICTARKQSPWLAATLLVPGVNLFLIPYLAFIPANPGLGQAVPAPNSADENGYSSHADQAYAQTGEGQPPVRQKIVLS
jgi:hypothetical protein